MRVNVYAEEMTTRVERVVKAIDGQEYVGMRVYLELPVTTPQGEVAGPFLDSVGDDDSAAITFWSRQRLATILARMLAMLATDRDAHVRKHTIDTISRELGLLVRDYVPIIEEAIDIEAERSGLTHRNE
jgi:septum formation topological specificity factor MinE